jgi:type 1 glutamine amidotransferase
MLASIRSRLLAGCVLVAAAAPLYADRPAVPGREAGKIQVLILTGYNMHPWRHTTAGLIDILERTGKFQVRVNEEPAGLTDATLRGYDAVVLNYTNYMQKFGPSWPEQTRQAILNFLAAGKGLVAYHAALSAFTEWPEYEKMIGGAWRKGAAHAPYHTFQVEIKDREHPVTRGFPSFEQPDELNQKLLMQPGIRLLGGALDDPANCTSGSTRICGSGKFEPVMWALEYRGGRVFTTALGHDLKSIATPGFIGTFQRGVEWAATGEVTIRVPAELGGNR